MKRNIKNEFKLILPATSDNATVAIETLSKFISNNLIFGEEASNIKVAVTEAVNNVVDHAYADNNYEFDNIILYCRLDENKLSVTVSDKGIGIDDLNKAKTPLFTTGSEFDHSGMGFTVMEQFSDSIYIVSKAGFGTKVRLTFKI